MRRSARSWLVVFCAVFCSAAGAQERAAPGSIIVKTFKDSLQLAPAKPPAATIDPRLAGMFADKVTECYQAESGQLISLEDRRLVVRYASELLPQFRTALQTTSCVLEGAASDDCLTQLSKLDCAPLAAVVQRMGWDRAPSPEMLAAVDKYTRELASRHFACRTGQVADEESNIRAEYLAHSASLQIALLLTTGQCTLVMTQLDACITRLASIDACKKLTELEQASRLPRYCHELLDCSAEPALVGKIAK